MADGVAVVADALWGQPCLSYLVQARVSDAALAALVERQAALPRQVALPLHLAPPRSLHVTVYGLILPRWPDAGKAAHWSAIADASAARLRASLAECRGLALRFEHLAVTPGAIIALARDPSGTIDAMRRRFAEIARPATQPAPRYDIIHMTLARFARGGSVPRADVAAVEATALALDAAVTSVDLVRERVYPTLEVDILARVALDPGSPAAR